MDATEATWGAKKGKIMRRKVEHDDARERISGRGKEEEGGEEEDEEGAAREAVKRGGRGEWSSEGR